MYMLLLHRSAEYTELNRSLMFHLFFSALNSFIMDALQMQTCLWTHQTPHRFCFECLLFFTIRLAQTVCLLAVLKCGSEVVIDS